MVRRLLLVSFFLLSIIGCSNDSPRSSSNSRSTQEYAVTYKPPLSPITISLGNEGLGFSVDATIATPIGTFGLQFANKIKNQRRPFQVDRSLASKQDLSRDYNYKKLNVRPTNARFVSLQEKDVLVIIKKAGGKCDLFKIKTDGELKVNTNGSTNITVRHNYIEIDVSGGTISNIQLYNVSRGNPGTYSYPNKRQTPSNVPTEYNHHPDQSPGYSRSAYSGKKDLKKQHKKEKKALKKQQKQDRKDQKKQKKLKKKKKQNERGY